MDDDFVGLHESLQTKIKHVCSLFLPFFALYFFEMGINSLNFFFVGYLEDNAQMAGLSMGMAIANVGCRSVIMGVDQALDTLISQTYGQKNLHLCGIYLNRARFVNIIIFVLLLPLLLKTEDILVYIGMNSEASKEAALFVNGYLVGLLASSFIDV